MRGRDQTNSRIRLGAWIVLALVAGAAGSIRGDEATEAIQLVGDRVHYWDRGAERWAVLEGHAAVLREAVGFRAARVVARIIPTDPGRSKAARVVVYAEEVKPTDPEARGMPVLRTTLETAREVQIRAFARGGLIQHQGPPNNLAVLRRAIPPATATRAPTRSVTPTSSRQAGPVAVLGPPMPEAPPPRGVEIVAPATPPKLDPAVTRAQFGGFDEPMGPEPPADPGPPPDQPLDLPEPIEPVDEGPGAIIEAEPRPAPDAEKVNPNPAPFMAHGRRVWSITPRSGGTPLQFEALPTKNGELTYVVRGGVIIVSETDGKGVVDISADSAVIWTRRDPKTNAPPPSPVAGKVEQPEGTPMEVYLEGNVIIRSDKRKFAGNGDQTTFEAKQAYYDFRTERTVALDGVFKYYAPGLVAPIKTHGKLLNKSRPLVKLPNGKMGLGSPTIQADDTMSTGSRFPTPGYQFTSNSVDLTQVIEPLVEPGSKAAATRENDSRAVARNNPWQIDARQNVYWIGWFPAFYWPRVRVDSDDLDPPLRNIAFRTGNYFGQQVLLDFNAFKLLGLRKPFNIDSWNFDFDYLSYRGIGLGTEMGWFGQDLISDFTDPYFKNKDRRSLYQPYAGYFSVWGIDDHGTDVLGSGPNVTTYPPYEFTHIPYQRSAAPIPKNLRGRVVVRHMQELLDLDTARTDEDLRAQFEVGYISDRNFLEEYYKRLFDIGMDQETLFYGIRQNRNQAVTLQTEGNLNNWYTESQWLPKLEYYNIGTSFLGGLLSYSQNSGVDYANVHTAVEVNNPYTFAYLPRDPVSNTSGPWTSGRAWTTHEIDMPLDLQFLRVVPYAQGQLIGWDNQLDYNALGRAWGGAGARVNVMAYRYFHNVNSEVWNVHGLAHKVNFDVDYRTAYSNVPLGRIGIQDDLDDNTYEFVRRYFAMSQYVGGLLPLQYDPRLLTLRRALNPIVFGPDIEASMQTVKLAVHNRLQTKRGPEGKRRIIDYMILDLQSIYYPNAKRDNFGVPFGQNMYNFEWYIGDRTSITSYGWFEFFKVLGDPVLINNPRHTNNPFGLDVISSGISIARPPRSNVYIGYSIINTGPIATSALNLNLSYWLSPKWYGTFGTSYDFGNAILLGEQFMFTKIGPDFLTSIGFLVDPQRNNYTFGFEFSPRFSPNVRLGAAQGARFDSRFAAQQ